MLYWLLLYVHLLLGVMFLSYEEFYRQWLHTASYFTVQLVSNSLFTKLRKIGVPFDPNEHKECMITEYDHAANLSYEKTFITIVFKIIYSS